MHALSLSFAVSEVDTDPLSRTGVPVVPHWTVVRQGLHRLLDRGAAGLLTVVSAPTGYGKTQGVASWVAGPTSPCEVVWVNLAHGGAEPDRVWRQIARGFQQTGQQDVPSFREDPSLVADRIRDLVELGQALRDRAPATVVLDGYPSGGSAQLGRELDIVLEHAGRSLRLVLLSRGEPALDLHRYSAAGELVRVREADLVMDDDEVAELLRLGNAPSDVVTAAAVVTHTRGWACGARRAAVALEAGAHLGEALDEFDRTLEDHLLHEVLGEEMPAPVRDLLVWTSAVEVVTPEMVRSVLGPEDRSSLQRVVAETGLVRTYPDGSLTCHPLLREAAQTRITGQRPDDDPDRLAAHAALVRLLADTGQVDAAVVLCLATRDWPEVASILVQSHAVPRLVAGTADPAVRRAAQLSAVQATEPLLHAAVAMSRHDLGAAELAMAAYVPGAAPGPARALAAAFVRLGLARFSGRRLADPDLVTRARHLLAEASVADHADLADLAVCLDALTGALELTQGRLDRAIVSLTWGADLVGGGGHRAALDCAGQLAVLEAHLGNLDQAVQRAERVLIAADGEHLAGVTHAHLALAWVHVERGQLAEAQIRLERAKERSMPGGEPWLQGVLRVVEARALILSGRPDEAIKVAGFPGARLAPHDEWLTGLVTVVTAEALLASGEPQQALAAVTVGLSAGSPERAVLTALARRDIGDVRGAAAAMASTADDLPRAPRATQLQGWMLQARLAFDRGQSERANLLVERLLRAASAEGFRRPLADEGEWLRWFLDRDGAALRSHRPFVRSLVAPDEPPRAPQPWVTPDQAVVEPLTERETQVLELLAQMCSTDEIAAELFVSANTVKTHLKGIFRKYAVNRRVDAVRRGRELGVC